jgi:ribonuclease E
MTKRMLIDATHAEETRVVVLDGNQLEDFDVETSTKRQLKGNIYLAKIVRVEPSLQAAFVEYGGGRHGFLAFGEIHPDYYQIPVADRQRLLAMQAEEARAEAEAEDEEDAAEAGGRRPQPRRPRPAAEAEPEQPSFDLSQEPGGDAGEPDDAAEATIETAPDFVTAPQAEAPDGPPAEAVAEAAAPHAEPEQAATAHAEPHHPETGHTEPAHDELHHPEPDHAEPDEDPDAPHRPAQAALMVREERFGAAEARAGGDDDENGSPDGDDTAEILPPPETIGGDSEQSDAAEEASARRTSRFLRNYRIQEVIKRRQILLVQVVKEERGTKGAALTTYISLAGRFCVLMPNSPRGGGISRKITSAADRRRLKEITGELEIPTGMGLIVRTAGANRPKAEIKRDCEYLMRLWDDIREHTLRSVAPSLIYEEASLIKRAIRDVYSRDIDEVMVDGEEGWKAAHDFMRMLMPSHAKKVQLWRGNGGGPNQPLFAKYQVEAQLDAMLAPTVQLKSGGYLVINQAEALVAIDVNSGRSTRERGIEETALRTNLEAADEVARQLRLRDLAGLIVIDFIDMEAKKHNAAVERRLKDALRIDRARIQVGHISHFGLMEMSRQRLRPSLAETSFVTCPHCGGLGHVRSTESAAIHVLRGIEDEGAKGRASLIMVHVASSIALYLLNNKRDRLAEIEVRYAMRVHFTPDDTLVPPALRIDRVKPQVPESERPVFAAPVAPAAPALALPDGEYEEEADDIVEAEVETAVTVASAPAQPRPPRPAEARDAAATNADGTRRRRRRRRRGGRRDQNGQEIPGTATAVAGDEAGAFEEEAGPDDADDLEDAIGEALAETGAPAVDDVLPAEPVDLAEAEQPSLDAAELDENGLPKPRRRGRRGGRRRRRGEGEGEEAVAAPAAVPAPAPAAAYVPPVYSGPTPADPFGSAPFDIFDIMDQAETAAAAAPPPPAPVIAAPPAEATVAEPVVAEPPPEPPAPAPTETPAPEAAVPEAVVVEAAAEPAPAEAAPTDVAPIDVAAIEPAPVEAAAVAVAVAEVEAPAPAPQSVEPPAEPPAPAPIVGPAVKPIVIGQDEVPTTERKRGWWKK